LPSISESDWPVGAIEADADRMNEDPVVARTILVVDDDDAI
jgi:hypothetical protein